jgi:hypothetical protein
MEPARQALKKLNVSAQMRRESASIARDALAGAVTMCGFTFNSSVPRSHNFTISPHILREVCKNFPPSE